MNEEKILEIRNKKFIIPEEPPTEEAIIEEKSPVVEIPKLPVTGM